MKKLISKFLEIYPDRTKKLRIRDYFILAAIDFGWAIVLWFVIWPFLVHWSARQSIIRMEIRNYAILGIAWMGNFFIMELFMTVCFKLAFKINHKNRRNIGTSQDGQDPQ